MRQNVGPKKVKKYKEQTGLPVVGADGPVAAENSAVSRTDRRNEN